MKKAFTLIELVIVIVIIGILSTQISPNFNRDGLQEAANQIVSHIRYTQHLAMMDNKFDPVDQNWFRERWQIEFTDSEAGSPNGGNKVYSIFTDVNQDAIMDNGTVEMAQNPINGNQFLTGWMSADNSFREGNYTKSMDIGETYNVQSILPAGRIRIAFDNMGRPYNYNAVPANMTAGLLTAQFQITLGDGTDTKIILIEPETGYTHIQ